MKSGKLVQIKREIYPEIVSVSNTLVFAADRIAGNIALKSYGWMKTLVFKLWTQAHPIVEQMPLGQNKLKGSQVWWNA